MASRGLARAISLPLAGGKIPRASQMTRSIWAGTQTRGYAKANSKVNRAQGLDAITQSVTVLTSPTGNRSRVPNPWLRDACTCSICVDPSSGQKNFATTDVPKEIRFKSNKLLDDGSVEVEWSNDFLSPQKSHISTYSQQFVEEAIGAPYRTHVDPKISTYTDRRSLWNRATMNKHLTTIDYNEWIRGDQQFAAGMEALWQFGIVFIQNVPESETSVNRIGEKIGHLQETFYGLTWDVISKPSAENVAYTSKFLGLHQDLQYMAIPPKIQILHCLANSCEGGESLFSDGIKTVADMTEAEVARPSDNLRLLKSRKVAYAYDRNGNKYSNGHRVVDELKRAISWAPPFQASGQPLLLRRRLDDDYMDIYSQWVDAARDFQTRIESESNMFELKMEPGTCVLFDNHRVLHGRRQFETSSGSRWLKGAYIEDDVLKSKMLDLLDSGAMNNSAGEDISHLFLTLKPNHAVKTRPGRREYGSAASA